MSWIVPALALTGAVALIWLLYAWIAPEPADLLPDRIVFGGERKADFMRTLASHINAPIIDGNRVELLENGVEIFPPMLDAIRNAEETIHLLTYIYWSGDIAVEFATALADAAQRGVEVRVLLDAFGAKRMEDRLIETMRNAGCQVRWFHAVKWYNLRRLNNRTHRKVLVIDGRVGFTGGVGIAAEWTGDAEDEDHWRDDHFRVTGPVVPYLQGGFAENWLDATGEVVAAPRLYPQLEPLGKARILPILASPRGDLSPVALSYWLAFRTAQHRIDLTTPYFVADRFLLEALKDAVARGVRVRLLVPGDKTDSKLVRLASFPRYDELIRAGVLILEYQPTLVHAKAMVVDDDLCMIGSANFDNRSFELNDEIVLYVKDAEFTELLSDSFERDLKRAVHVTLERYHEIPLWRRALGHAALMLREQL
jgi:cardiolipin synthase